MTRTSVASSRRRLFADAMLASSLLALLFGLSSNEATAKPKPPAKAKQINLAVSFVSQMGAKCGTKNYLCQYASASMLAGQAWGSRFAKLDIVKNMAFAVKGSSCGAMSTLYDAQAGLRWLNPNADIRVTHWSSYDSLKDILRGGRPASVNVLYSRLGKYRKDTGWKAGHTVVVVGFDEVAGTWTYLDPLAIGNGRVTVPSATFRDAVTGMTGDTNVVGYMWIVW